MRYDNLRTKVQNHVESVRSIHNDAFAYSGLLSKPELIHADYEFRFAVSCLFFAYDHVHHLEVYDILRSNVWFATQKARG